MFQTTIATRLYNVTISPRAVLPVFPVQQGKLFMNPFPEIESLTDLRCIAT